MQPKTFTASLFIISAPSGAGKSSLIKAYLNQADVNPAKVSVSHTTRDSRPGERHAEHYYFVDKPAFEAMINQNAFLEYAKVYDNYYGTSRQEIEGWLDKGVDVFLDIDWQGAQQVRAAMPEAKSVFILPPSLAELAQRLVKRGQDSEDVIAKRMLKAQSEMSHYAEYDYLIINDNFERALAELTLIIRAQKLTTPSQTCAHTALLAELLD